MGASLSDHRMHHQPVVRNFTAIDAHFRSSAGAMGKRGKGRTKRDSTSRQNVRASLRRGDF